MKKKDETIVNAVFSTYRKVLKFLAILVFLGVIGFDNKQVTIPNGNLSANVIINYSAKDVRRLDLQFEISYDEDANKVIEIISNVVNNHQLVLDKPAPFVRVGAYEKSSTVIYTRVWVKTPEYWDANWDLLEQVRKALNDNNIKIPYNKLEINTKK
ncbi:MAG: mechanosensitive ion channel [Erysipelotrichaceae bacterium]|nr:mechanosensitive ion channel [Erysipelotrichaceae bacterium]